MGEFKFPLERKLLSGVQCVLSTDRCAVFGAYVDRGISVGHMLSSLVWICQLIFGERCVWYSVLVIELIHKGHLIGCLV